MVMARVAFPWLMKINDENNHKLDLPSYLVGFSILALASVSFAFYLRFVGSVGINFAIMIKVVLICFAPVVVLRLYDVINELKQKNESLLFEKKIIQKQIEKYEEDYLNKSVEFISENSAENFTLLIADVASIKSADNYVEITYKEGNDFKKKLVRNTLRNIEVQLRPYSNFIRCHRTYIVNIHFLEKLDKKLNNHWISIKGLPEQIPVSRQYLLKLKESI
jgi:DNA-binding LytR/AlgR family response regulator